MTTETKLQHDLIKSVKAEGGYAHKRSSRFQVGISDLLINFPGFCPVIVEVKDLGAVPAKFSRQLAVTAKQALDLQRYDEAQNLDGVQRTAAFLLVGFIWNKEHLLAYLPRTTKRLASDIFDYPSSGVICRGVGLYYPLRAAFEGLNVPRII